MANSAQARKRARQAEQHRQRNMMLRSRVRTYIKKVLKAIQQGDKQLALESFKSAQPFLDGAVNKGIFHKNKVARHKSRIFAKIKALPDNQVAA